MRVASFLTATLCCVAAHGQNWTPRGPSPLQFGGVEQIATNNPSVGAINAIAPHPSNADIIYIGSVNGGIWRTSNATSANPSWAELTDDQQTTGVGDIEFDPTDNTNQTLLAGFGRFSSYGRRGGPRSGLIRTTDGGTNWTNLDATMVGRNVIGVAPRGSVLVAAIDVADEFFCSNVGIFRSTNSGATFTQVTNGIPAGVADVLQSDPGNNAVLYASIVFGSACTLGGSNGIYKSTDTGASWTKVSNAAMDALLSDSSTTHVEIAVGNAGQVYVAIVPFTGQLGGLFRSPSGNSGTWTQLDTPGSNEPSFIGIHPGGQGSLHMSLAADPSDANVVYIGGDRQPRDEDDTGGFPNSLGANTFSGRLFRVDASQTSGSQVSPLTHSGTASGSSPHADSRDMRFDADGDLLESDDGGIFRRTSPEDDTGDWFDVNGDLQVTEQHSMVYDTTSSIVVSGNQDNGTTQQNSFLSTTWISIQGGDGGDVAVDVLSEAGSNISTRFVSSQFLGNARRLRFNSSNGFLGSIFLPLTVTSGADIVARFTTPWRINNINGDRLVIGGANSVYESTDQGDTIVELSPSGIVSVSGGRDGIANGATGNEHILYIAAEDGNLYRRTTSGGALSSVYTASDGDDVQGVILDPSTPANAFLIENARVFRTTDTGASFSEITGNLISGFSPGQLRSIVYLESGSGDAIAVGADRGVYLALAADGFSTWTAVGSGLPNAPVYELAFDPAVDRLVAGTLGRGTFTIDGALAGALGSNTAPDLTNDTATVAEGGTVDQVNGGNSSVLDNDSDLDGDNLTVTTTAVSGPSNGSLTLAGNGTFSYTHNGSETTSDSFVYEACDDGSPSICANATVNITITEVNDPMSAEDDDLSAVAEDSGLRTIAFATLLGNDDPGADEDGQNLTIISVANPVGGTVTINGTDVEFTPAQDFNGTARFDYSARDDGTTNGSSDPTSDSASVSFTVTEVNDAPVVSGETLASVVEDAGTQSYTFASLLGNDDPGPANEAGQALTISAVGSAVGGSVLINGTSVEFTPAANFNGAAGFSYTIQDNGTTGGAGDPQSADATASFIITEVNDPPVVSGESLADVAEDAGTQSYSFASLLGNDSPGPSNEAGQALTISAVGSAVGGSVLINGTSVEFTPTADFNGAASFGYTVSDTGTTGGGADPGAADGTATFTITEANDPPNVSGETLPDIPEDSGVQTIAFATLLGNDNAGPADESGQTLTISAVGSAVGGAVSIDGTNVEFTPSPDFSGPASFAYTVEDDGTTDGGADPQSADGTASFTVTEVNDPPNVNGETLADVAEDAPTQVISFATLLANDNPGPADESGQNLTVTAVGGAVGGSAAINGSNVEFTPAQDFNGAAGFTYTVQDDGTTDGASDPRTGDATAGFTVTEVNDPPVAAGETLADVVGDPGTQSIPFATLLANDEPGPANETGQTLTISAVGSPVGGTVSINGGSVAFTPADGFDGAASFAYTVRDDGTTNGAADPRTAGATASFTITSVNEPPTVVDDTFTMDSNTTLLADVSTNDSDPDSPTLTFSRVSGPANGTLDLATDGSFEYTPNPGYSGTDEFTYEVSDGTNTVQAGVRIGVGVSVLRDGFEE